MKRFTQLPITLYKIQPNLPVNLKTYQNQLNTSSFDLKLYNNQVIPISHPDSFKTPNGMSLRPASNQMLEILHKFNGNPTIYCLLSGLKLPDGLCIYHEHTNHYSLQTTTPISIHQFNANLTNFLKSLPTMDKNSFIEMMNDENDFDN
ncbi:hypothetical protein HDV02_006317 [Globomyces sp. JEL0801]|nr:hypothetical protein HDV02_006317 [Globomyces sp. JEL0801]